MDGGTTRRVWMITEKAMCCLSLFLLGLSIVACAPSMELPTATTETAAPPTQTSTPTDTASLTLTLVPTSTDAPSATYIPRPTATSTGTPLPRGYIIVPEVVGMDYEEARQVLLDSGFTFIYHDVFDLEQPVGTVIGQDPAPGTVKEAGEAVFLYRAFRASAIDVGGGCRSLRLTYPTGKLLYSVYLNEDERYEIRTDFPYGQTTIFEYRMIIVASFDNQRSDYVFFTPAWTGWYVISLGPYQISQQELDKYPSGVPAGCVSVYPPEW